MLFSLLRFISRVHCNYVDARAGAAHQDQYANQYVNISIYAKQCSIDVSWRIFDGHNEFRWQCSSYWMEWKSTRDHIPLNCVICNTTECNGVWSALKSILCIEPYFFVFYLWFFPIRLDRFVMIIILPMKLSENAIHSHAQFRICARILCITCNHWLNGKLSIEIHNNIETKRVWGVHRRCAIVKCDRCRKI